MSAIPLSLLLHLSQKAWSLAPLLRPFVRESPVLGMAAWRANHTASPILFCIPWQKVYKKICVCRICTCLQRIEGRQIGISNQLLRNLYLSRQFSIPGKLLLQYSRNFALNPNIIITKLVPSGIL